MSQIEEALYAKLTGNAGVNAVVSGRVRPQLILQADAFPAIRYERLGGDQHDATEGALGIANAELVLECWAATYTAAKALRDLVRLALQASGGRGSVAISGGAAVKIRRTHLTDSTDPMELAIGREQQRKWGAAMMASLWYFEATS